MTVMASAERFNAAAFFVDRHLEQGRGQQTAFRHAHRVVTYAELVECANRAGNVLASLGVEIEHRVLLILHDTPAFPACFWGAAKLGAVAVPLNPLLTTEEYDFFLDDSRARVVVAEPEVAARLAARRDRWPSLRAVVSGGAAVPGAPALAELMATASPGLAPAPTVADDVMYWGYTSGSTGPPKAAVHTHRDFVAAADLVGIGVFGLGADDLVFSASKLYFAFGLGNSLYFPLRVGAASVLLPERPTPEMVFEIIAAERPTVLFAVATLYARMLHVPDAEGRWDLSSLRLCVSSGEALPPTVFDAWKSRFGHELLDVVGSTEALHDFIANIPGAVRRGSSGRLIPGFEARLEDDAGRPVFPGHVGELLIKGPTTAPYYWNRRERTRQTMLGEWLRTGDMFWQDADGYYYFSGRADDMLKVGGQWVSPAEVEAALVAHPAVVEAGVVGRQDGDGLVKPDAFVVLKDGLMPSAELAGELSAFVRGRLAGYKSPRWVQFVAELPKTPTGKIQRFQLRRAGA